jgi:hypothetical protein
MVLASLRQLQDEVKIKVKEAENHRWRKWLLGGAMSVFLASFMYCIARSAEPNVYVIVPPSSLLCARSFDEVLIRSRRAQLMTRSTPSSDPEAWCHT